MKSGTTNYGAKKPAPMRTALALLPLCVLAASLPAKAATELEEVVITAERREASLQDTAAAITALSGEALEKLGVTSPSDLASITPALYTHNAGGIMQFYVRGVGSFSSNAFAEGAVSLNLNGVYISRANTYQGLFHDLDRIEVLKGPQGTLYGRNSTGGAVNLITKRPDIGGEFSGYASAEVGNYQHKKFSGALNIPISEQFALRAALQTIERDGYIGDGTEDADSFSARISGLYESDSFSMLTVIDAQDIDQIGTGSIARAGTLQANGDLTPNGFLDPSDPFAIGATSPEANALLAANPPPFARGPLGTPAPFTTTETLGFSSELNWDTDFGTVTLLPAYRDTEFATNNYGPGFLIDATEEAEQTSLELRIASDNESNFQWIVGAYYFDEEIKNRSFFFQNILFFTGIAGQPVNSTDLNVTNNTESQAVFGEGTYDLTDNFRLKAGLRYTEEEKSTIGSNHALSPGGPPAFFGDFQFAVTGEFDDSKTTWKLGAEYDVSDDSLLYATLSTGYKAGGFYGEQQSFGNTFEAETITAYALGSKSTFADGRLRLNAELFYWDYEDHQESHLTASPGGYALFITENIGNATMKGIDVELDYLFTESDTISLQGQLLDATFNDFSYSAFSGSGAPPPSGCTVTPTVPRFFDVNCDGKDAIRAPSWSVTLTYQHIFDLGDNGELAFTLRSQIEDETFTSIDYLSTQLADGYSRTDATLGYTSEEKAWSVNLWVRNIEDEATITDGFVSPFTTITYSPLRSPRTYGANIKYSF